MRSEEETGENERRRSRLEVPSNWDLRGGVEREWSSLEARSSWDPRRKRARLGVVVVVVY